MHKDYKMEEEIQALGLVAPRVTPKQIDSMMAKVTYHTYVVPGTTTTVAVAMRDGFTLCQEIQACVDPANFNEALGKKYAIEKATEVARDRLWGLEGYKLKFPDEALPETDSLQPHEVRLVLERKQLGERLGALSAFLASSSKPVLPEVEYDRLYLQQGLMQQLYAVLTDRITAITEDNSQ